MDYLHEEEDDYPDEDDEGGRRNGNRGIMRPSALMKNIKKLRRVSIISKPLSKIGSGRHSLAINADDDDDSASSDDDDSDESRSNSGKGGFLKRKTQKKKAASKKKKKKKEEKPSTINKNPKRTLLRRSFHKEYGGMSRSAASRTLRMSIAGSSGSQDDGDEKDDIPMPLPGQEKNNSTRRDDNGTTGTASIYGRKKPQKKIKKKASFASDNYDNEQGNSNNNNSKKRGLGSTRDTLSSGDSHRGSRHSKSRRRQKQPADDGSVDSPPSVASTDENSGDRPRQQHQQSQLLPHSSYSRALNSKKNKSKRYVLKRQEGDEQGLGFESEHHDFYYQSVIWILKSWMYFVTILIPFSLCYYMFVGIFQSTNISNNKLFQKIYFANILFYGNGCSWRGDFWARQSLDCKGSESTYFGVPARINFSANNTHEYGNQYNRSSGNGSRGKRMPPKNRSQDYRYSSMEKGARRSTTTFRSQNVRGVRRKSMPTQSSTSEMMTNNTHDGANGHLPHRTRAPAHRAGPLLEQNNHATHSVRRKVANSTNASNSSTFGVSSTHSRKGSGSLTMNGSSHHSTAPSVWDVEKILESTKKKPAGSARPRPKMDKTVSIMEIYDFHATDEKVAMLQ